MATSAQRTSYSALVVVSPAPLLGEEKNQDTAHWCGPRLVAAVCDGVSSSPHAAAAAGIAAPVSPILFTADPRQRLGALCDLLLARRAEALDAGIASVPGTNPALQRMLSDVAREKTQTSYQTTLIAAQLRPEPHCVVAHSVGCGDSAFFAYSPDNNLLASSLIHTGRDLEEPPRCLWPDDAVAGAEFGPGDELLARVLGDAAENRDLIISAGIGIGSGGKWLVCQPLDRSTESCRKPANRPPSRQSLRLKPNDLLLVPRYLASFPDDPTQRRYCRFPFSRHIRLTSGAAPSARPCRLDEKGNRTAVLPDSFLAGQWYEAEERFEPDTEFVLASDGFYSAFTDTAELWAWLTANEAELASEVDRQPLLDALHAQLHSKSGDDDMSFVWIRPHVGACNSELLDEEHTRAC